MRAALLPRLSFVNYLIFSLALLFTSSAVAQTAPEQTAKDDDIVSIDQLQIEGTRPLEMTGELRDMAGYDDVYERNLSTAYIGKEMVERFKGAAPADVLKGLLNVHSGDSRNSGALDPNIRGIQGPGRVPVTIDGTEQALTVWRGYNGANNRNYIDPNLIGGIQVFKGPGLERDAPASVGGAVVIKTLDADDILHDGQNFGMEVRVEGSNNAVAPRIPTLLTGRHVDEVKKEISGWSYLNDTTLYVPPRNSNNNNIFSIKDDYSYRVALAGHLGDVSLMGAYAYRNKGNHFAGKRKAGFYSEPETKYTYDQIHTLAHSYRPGDEVPNTSSEMESWLFKVTWKPSANQQLTAGYRATLNNHGEIMPSRLNWNKAIELGVPQWPISQVDMKAYSLNYRWIADNPWVDLHVNVWRTDTETDGYNSGGYPNYASPLEKNPMIINTAVLSTSNDRNGISLSNRMQLFNTLNLTVGGNAQHEKLRSRNDIQQSKNEENDRRSGRREEYDVYLNIEWQPLERLTLTGGARYSSYWSIDDLLAERVKAGKQSPIYKEKGRTASYFTEEITTEELIKKLHPNYPEAWLPLLYRQYADLIAEGKPWPKPLEHLVDWYADVNGRYHRADNPCTNGMINKINIPNLTPGIRGLLCSDQGTSAYSSTDESIKRGLVERITPTSVDKKRGYDWVPAFSAIYQLTDNGRIYLRHSQAIRYPSMFESTIGFSASPSGWGIKPEHTYNNEITYIYNYKNLSYLSRQGNIKLTYFHHRTKNVIERDRNLRFSNIEQQTINGIELQGRFDSGFFFTDLGLTWNLENEVCDEHTAVKSDFKNGSIPNCVRGGFIGGYLLSMVIPKFSANGLIGSRFFNRKLETGVRVTYHKKHQNIDFENYMEKVDGSSASSLSMYRNIPLEWGNITVFDVYANWQFSENFSAELTGTNLGNIYYVDPITRSAFPAPGRTLKLALTYQF